MKAFKPRIERLGKGLAHILIEAEGRSLRYQEVLGLWQADEGFRSLFISILEGVEYHAFRWETPPLTAATVERLFECVILDAPSLNTPGDSSAFADHFRNPPPADGVVAFPNLGGDALLVVPVPKGRADSYGHLAAFTRQAPRDQNHALWQAVGREVEASLASRPIWLNTAGGGVPWLHVRLDTRPKYYGYRPYAEDMQPGRPSFVNDFRV